MSFWFYTWCCSDIPLLSAKKLKVYQSLYTNKKNIWQAIQTILKKSQSQEEDFSQDDAIQIIGVFREHLYWEKGKKKVFSD